MRDQIGRPGSALVDPFANSLIETLFIKRFQQIIDGMVLEGLDSIFVEGRREDAIAALFGRIRIS